MLNSWIRGVALSVAALGIGAGPASAVTIYDNTVNEYTASGFNPGTIEHGDEVTLAGTERTVVSFEFVYSLATGEGDETARVRFYANDGASSEPGSLLYDSGAVSIPVTGGPYVPVELSGLSVSVPDTFTWTVTYDGTGQNVLNRSYDPPVVGSSDNGFYWRRTGAGPWETGTFGAAPANFYARIEAVPEPTTALLLGIGLAGSAAVRSRRPR